MCMYGGFVHVTHALECICTICICLKHLLQRASHCVFISIPLRVVLSCVFDSYVSDKNVTLTPVIRYDYLFFSIPFYVFFRNSCVTHSLKNSFDVGQSCDECYEERNVKKYDNRFRWKCNFSPLKPKKNICILLSSLYLELSL